MALSLNLVVLIVISNIRDIAKSISSNGSEILKNELSIKEVN
jgi:hypothetical protein